MKKWNGLHVINIKVNCYNNSPLLLFLSSAK